MLLKKVNIRLDTKFSNLDKLRVLHVSDLHLTGRNRKIEQYFNKLAKVKIDFAMITGDLVDNDNGIEWCIKYLKKLSARHGSWAVLGNHDKCRLNILDTFDLPWKRKLKDNDIGLLKKRLSENNIQVLVNDKKTININSIPITIVGSDVPLHFEKNSKNLSKEIESIRRLLLGVKQDNYVIFLNHVPHLLKELGKVNIHLALCGHTHGGQMRLPFIGPVLVFSAFQRKYNMGLYKYDGYALHISAGLGISKTTPIRFLCPPEATVLTMREDKKTKT